MGRMALGKWGPPAWRAGADLQTQRQRPTHLPTVPGLWSLARMWASAVCFAAPWAWRRSTASTACSTHRCANRCVRGWAGGRGGKGKGRPPYLAAGAALLHVFFASITMRTMTADRPFSDEGDAMTGTSPSLAIGRASLALASGLQPRDSRPSPRSSLPTTSSRRLIRWGGCVARREMGVGPALPGRRGLARA